VHELGQQFETANCKSRRASDSLARTVAIHSLTGGWSSIPI